MKKIILKLILTIFAILFMLSIFKEQPRGIDFESDEFVNVEVDFLKDLTYGKGTKKIVEQEIFDTVYKTINEAEDFIIVDMFLFNDNYAKKEEYPNLSKKLSEKLIEKKQENPEIKIIFITDPINTFYGSYKNPYLENMKKENINVVITDLDKLSNSNPLYSTFWDNGLKLIHGEKTSKGSIKNPFGDKDNKIHLTSGLKMLNFKANHRKAIITEKTGMILSANPHGASFYHSNVGFLFKGELLNDLLKTELNVIRFSDKILYNSVANLKVKSTIEGTDIKGKIITEKRIRTNLIKYIEKLEKGDELKTGMFYLSEYKIIQAIRDASNRGVNVELILDANKDAFGMDKIGIPNVSVAKILTQNSDAKVRWYDTHGEQFHSKITILNYKEETVVIGGSANLTRRNINNYNLETNILLKTNKNSNFSIEVNDYFNKIYENKNGNYTADYSNYKDHSIVKQVIYLFQEFTGLGTF